MQPNDPNIPESIVIQSIVVKIKKIKILKEKKININMSDLAVGEYLLTDVC